MSTIPQLHTIIKKLVMRNYPELTEFEVRDLFANDSLNIESWLGHNYVVDFYTSECLSTKKQIYTWQTQKPLDFGTTSGTKPHPQQSQT